MVYCKDKTKIEDFNLPADLVVYALVAAGLVFWLRNILGTRDVDDPGPQPINIQDHLPDAKSSQPPGIETTQDVIAALADTKGIAGVDNQTAVQGLVDISDVDKNFDIHVFLQAAQDAFAIVVESFADGDRETLEDLLSPEVYAVFESVIKQREDKGEKHQSEIHAVKKADVIEARLEKKMAYITVRFVADETAVAYDDVENIISGHPDKTSEMKDIWVFGRDTKSKDPRWLVYETRSDFEGDNETVPNTD